LEEKQPDKPDNKRLPYVMETQHDKKGLRTKPLKQKYKPY
jgi:hypothetical protein